MGERPTWRVTAGPGGLLIDEILLCIHVFRMLSPRQREAVLSAVDGRVSGHPLTLRALRSHGITDESDRLTEAGFLVWKWNRRKGAT